MELSALQKTTSALETSLDSIEFWLFLSTLAVVIGLVIEYWFPLRELLRAFRERPFPWKLLLEMVGGILVTVGVAGELGFQSRASKVETTLRSDSHQIEGILNKQAADAQGEAAEARKEAEGFQSQIADSNARAKTAEAVVASANAASRDAVTKVATADARIAEAKKGAAEANETAERERLEREQLAQLLSPRTLTIDQQKKIGAACNRLYATGPNNRIDVESYGLDGEGAALAQEIIGALTSGLLYNNSDIAASLSTGAFDTGVLISAPPEAETFANCLADAFVNIGKLKDVTVNGVRHSGGTSMSGATIRGGYPSGERILTVTDC
jgi:hypothetical protein